MSWEERGACQGADPELFFPSMAGDTRVVEPARRICRTCPVLQACLGFALTHGVEGVWGGTTETERSRLREKFGLPVPEGFALRSAAKSPHSTTHPLESAVDRMSRGGASSDDIAQSLGTTSRTVQRIRAHLRTEGVTL